jgi:hypothetical protein
MNRKGGAYGDSASCSMCWLPILLLKIEIYKIWAVAAGLDIFYLNVRGLRKKNLLKFFNNVCSLNFKLYV